MTDSPRNLKKKRGNRGKKKKSTKNENDFLVKETLLEQYLHYVEIPFGETHSLSISQKIELLLGIKKLIPLETIIPSPQNAIDTTEIVFSLDLQSMLFIILISLMDHSNLLPFVGIRTSGRSYILYFQKLRSLCHIETEFSMETKTKFAVQLLGAVDYLHQFRICHRNISIKKLLIDEKSQTLYLGGYWNARFLDNTQTFSSPDFNYCAPETVSMFRESNSILCDNTYLRSDIYSLGHALYEIYTQKVHPDINSSFSLKTYLMNSKSKNSVLTYPYNIPKHCEWKGIISQCWNIQPNLRPTIPSIIIILRRIISPGSVLNNVEDKMKVKKNNHDENEVITIIDSSVLVGEAIESFIRVSSKGKNLQTAILLSIGESTHLNNLHPPFRSCICANVHDLQNFVLNQVLQCSITARVENVALHIIFAIDLINFENFSEVLNTFKLCSNITTEVWLPAEDKISENLKKEYPHITFRKIQYVNPQFVTIFEPFLSLPIWTQKAEEIRLGKTYLI